MTPHPAIPSDASDFACVDFVNSAFSDHLGTGQSTDRLDSTEWLQWFLGRYDLTPDREDPPPVAELVTLRRDLRRVLEKWSSRTPLSRRDLRLLDERVRSAPYRMRLTKTSSGLALGREPLERSWDWVVASVATSAVELQRDGDPRRLKTCDNPDCSWMFYDNTVNRSRRFCSTTPCGSLIRVRRFRQRL
jgi:predicted RNA-binding Zn ribbon-like protein